MMMGSNPSVVFQAFGSWAAGRIPDRITNLGTIATSPDVDPSVMGGTAAVYYDQIANQMCIDTVS